MTEVSDKEVDAALQELLHERNSQGDGCFGCGSGAHWGQKSIDGRVPFYRDMLRRILGAAKKVQAPAQSAQSASEIAQRSRPRVDI